MDQLADLLLQSVSGSVRVFAYHAGHDMNHRQTVLRVFTDTQQRGPIVVCCSSAFGTGIDVPCVRLVVHFGPSLTMLDYLQSVGRGGRDGRPARCVLIDWPSARHIALRILPATQRRSYDDLNIMLRYSDDTECYRAYLRRFIDGTGWTEVGDWPEWTCLAEIARTGAVEICDRCRTAQNGTSLSTQCWNLESSSTSKFVILL